MDLSVQPDFIIGIFLGAVMAMLVKQFMDAQQRRAEKARIEQARSVCKKRGFYPARYWPGLVAKKDIDLGTAMLLVASEGEILIDRDNRIAGYIESEPRGPRLRLVVSNDNPVE